MKFIHTGDLHIGKMLGGFNLLDDQKYILNQIIEIACTNNVDAVVLTGDLYDRSVPSSEAVTVFDYFISTLNNKNIKVLAINGNHDSAERLGFANTIMAKQGYYIESSYSGELKCVKLQDEYGDVNFYLMPFVRPAFIDEFYDYDVKSSNDSVKAILDNSIINTNNRNVIIAHHFVTNSGTLPGEEKNDEFINVGDTDNVDVSCFNIFDYTALGHIHRAMKIGVQNAYYAGSPLKYSLREAGHKKSIYLVELKEKDNINIDRIFLTPIRDLRIIKGDLHDLLKDEIINLANPLDYICAVLTNTEEIIDPIGKLRNIYPNIIQVQFEKNLNIINYNSNYSIENLKDKSTFEMYDSFYRYVTNTCMDEDRKEIIMEIIEEVNSGEKL